MSLLELTRTYGRLAWPRPGTAWRRLRYLPLAGLYLAALTLMYRSEYGVFATTLALLSFAFLNAVLLTVLRRPIIVAVISLVLLGSLILLSSLKFDVSWMTISFFDLLIIDTETFSFLLAMFPQQRIMLMLAALVVVPAIGLVWWFDPFRVRRLIAASVAAVSLAGMTAMSLLVPEQPWEPFQGVNHLSNFARSGVSGVTELMTRGMLQSDPAGSANETSRLAADNSACRPARKPPHIIMVLDESSFDITAAPGIRVPPGYRQHFRSFDGKSRSFVVEASGGPTWYAEYSVLTGLSARSFGRFKFFVTRIAANRVSRGLPQALRRCGYQTSTLYPVSGAFLSAKKFQATTGIEHFIDQQEMKARDPEPDRFYFDQAVRTLQRKSADQPMFMFVYVAANHFPWTSSYRPDLTPNWRGPGNTPEVDEYIRRQTMSAQDYAAFRARLAREFPGESFLIVRFGDHQPAISARLLDPNLDDAAIAQRVMEFDPRHFSTYYAIDTINFDPVDLSSARDTLEAPYLPLVIQEAAGLPLDASFAEQKRILQRCDGAFYGCRDGAEARRFNRLLIDAGLIKGL
jgi:hypothetical protein